MVTTFQHHITMNSYDPGNAEPYKFFPFLVEMESVVVTRNFDRVAGK